MDDDDFLAAVEADNKGTAPAEELKPAETPAEEPKQEPKPEPQPEEAKADEKPLELTEVVVEAPKQVEPGFVPIAAMLDARDKAKAAEAELQRLRAAQQQQQQRPLQMPDPYEDPEGYAAAQQAQVEHALYQTNLRWSERIATIQHGEETVKAAKDWAYAKCDEDPYFNARVAASPDPVGLAVAEYKREEIASKVTPDEFAQFQAWKAAQAQVQQQTQPAAPAAQPSQTSAIPPPSLASAPSAGSILTEPIQSDEEIFNEVVGKR